MRKLFFYVILSALVYQAKAQMFSPSASALPDGELNSSYTGQVIDFTVPATTTVPGEFVEQAIGIAFPQAAPVIGLLGLGSQTFDFNVERATLLPDGLPSGLSANCDATPCTYIEGASGFITISGTPTEAGTFTMDITVLAEGEADISSIGGGILSQFGIPSSFALPTPVPSSLTEEGYTINVNSTSGIAEFNESFNLRLFPNPTTDISSLLINTKRNGKMLIEVLNIQGVRIDSFSKQMTVGENLIKVDLSGYQAGIYLIKATLDEKQALVKFQKL